MKKAIVLALVLAPALASAVGKGKALYMGGTLPGVKDKTEAKFDGKGAENLLYYPKNAPVVVIPWANVVEVEYGQKAGRRVKTAIFLSPFALFGKARHHYVTLSWKDTDGNDQAAVFEFDKEDIRAVLATVKARTGKSITYLDEEAKKQMGGGVSN
jgi:hypothetical protein